MKSDFHRVDALLHQAKTVEPLEAETCLELAGKVLRQISAKARTREIVVRAQLAYEAGEILTRFRGLLSYAKAHGEISSAGAQLLSLAQQLPPKPKKQIIREGAAYFNFLTTNSKTISKLIKNL